MDASSNRDVGFLHREAEDIGGLLARGGISVLREGEARLEQEPLRHRRAPGRLVEAVRPEAPHAVGLGCGELAASPRLIRLRIGKGIDLVARRDLPCHTLALGPEPLTAEGGPLEVGRVQRRALRGIEVHASDLVLAAGGAGRGEEPETVALDRTADVEVRVVEVLHLVDGRHAAAAHVVGEVVALKIAVGVHPVGAAAEGVAALLGYEVDVEPAGVAFGGDRAGQHDSFLDRRRVHDVAGVAEHRLVARLHAVVGHLAAAFAVDGRRVGAVGRVDARRAAPVAVAVHPGHEARDAHEALRAARQRFDELVRDRRLLPDVLGVDERREL